MKPSPADHSRSRLACSSRTAANLSPEQMAAVAAYYAALPAAPKDWQVDQAQVALGETLVREGIWGQGVLPCTTCHGQNAEGVGVVFPRLAGQFSGYMKQRIAAWQSGADTADNPEEALMVSVARKLPPEHADAALTYLAALAPDTGPAMGYPAVATDWPEVPYNIEPVPPEIPWQKAQQAYEKQQERINRPDAYAHTPPDFPQFRGKNRRINTLPERIAGCFTYSMNGTPPPAQHRVMVALEAYMNWMGHNIPSDAVLKVRGYQYLPLPEQTPDYTRGEKVYQERCAVCHGEAGSASGG